MNDQQILKEIVGIDPSVDDQEWVEAALKATIQKAIDGFVDGMLRDIAASRVEEIEMGDEQ